MAPEGSPGANPVSWDGQGYARHSQIQRQFGERQISELGLGGGEAVLDIGCGDGRLTAELARRVAEGRVVGIDSSPEMIEVARETHQAHHHNLHFALVDATAMGFHEEFDLVFSTSSLHWIKDHGRVLTGIQRALKPGGRLHLAFGARGTVAGIARVMDGLRERPAWRPSFVGFEFPFGLYGPEEYSVWMEERGLAVDRMEMMERDVTHEGREAFEGWFRNTWMPYTHRVAPEQREAFIREAIDLYLEDQPIDDRGLIHVKMVSMLVTGGKAGRGTNAAGPGAGS